MTKKLAKIVQVFRVNQKEKNVNPFDILLNEVMATKIEDYFGNTGVTVKMFLTKTTIKTEEFIARMNIVIKDYFTLRT